jgi:nicotinamidase-related amidase
VLHLRSRVELFRGSGEWREVRVDHKLAPAETALLICDMWDNHWCRGASARVEKLVARAAPFIDRARRNGILIIHAPSDTMEFYKDSPQRRLALAAPPVEPPAPLALDAPPLPIDDSDGGCDTAGDKSHRAWSRQHAGIPVRDGDIISDKGAEVYNVLKLRGIRTLLVMGVHTNMCVLNRTFAIKQMTRWGVPSILVRDLTDAMYDPNDRPYVSHDRGTELVIEHIEKYWAPTTTSGELLAVLPKP